jgi:hypothetical protein
MLGAESRRDLPRMREFVETASWNPTENVLTRVDCCAINATTALESIPPLRNAPIGTSLI